MHPMYAINMQSCPCGKPPLSSEGHILLWHKAKFAMYLLSTALLHVVGVCPRPLKGCFLLPVVPLTFRCVPLIVIRGTFFDTKDNVTLMYLLWLRSAGPASSEGVVSWLCCTIDIPALVRIRTTCDHSDSWVINHSEYWDPSDSKHNAFEHIRRS
jgi:hypothetical protein